MIFRLEKEEKEAYHYNYKGKKGRISMQLLTLVLNRIDCLADLLAKWMAAGISGTTIVDCEGMVQVLGASSIEPPPIFGALRQFLNPEREKGKLLFTVLSDAQVETAKKIINEVVGGIEKPDTGIVFTIPLTSVEGLANR